MKTAEGSNIHTHRTNPLAAAVEPIYWTTGCDDGLARSTDGKRSSLPDEHLTPSGWIAYGSTLRVSAIFELGEASREEALSLAGRLGLPNTGW